MVAGRGLWHLDRFHLRTAQMAHEVLDDRLDVRSYRAESQHFVECVLQDWTPEVSGEDGLAALRISHAILTASRERQVVTLEGVMEGRISMREHGPPGHTSHTNSSNRSTGDR